MLYRLGQTVKQNWRLLMIAEFLSNYITGFISSIGYLGVGGRTFIDKYGKYFFMNNNHLEIAENWFQKHGDRAVFFSRLLPVVRTFISLPAGMGKYDFKKLVIFSFVGSIPWCFGLAYRLCSRSAVETNHRSFQ